MRIYALVAIFAFFALFLGRPADTAAQKLSFISDAEIESTIRAYGTPLFQAAGLEPSAIRIYLVKDSALNAFVAGGQNLFLNTGLLMRTEHAGQMIGVIAHEVGHIEGGHLSRTHAAMRNATAKSILTYVLAAAAAIGTGRPEIGQIVLFGGQQIGLRSLLRYSRTQESAADQSAIRLLEGTGQSAQGMLEFLAVLGDQELVSARHQDPYVRTHPLTRDRIDAMRHAVARSPHSSRPPSANFQEMHRRMRAKLKAFLNPISRTLREYAAADGSLEARYARAIAYYRRPDLANALPLIEGLIAERPHDPYFHELKGQVLFENGRIAESLEPYGTAVRLHPGSHLLRTALARAQLESNDPALVGPAIANLRAALQRNSRSAWVWRQLAIAYGRHDQLGMSSLAMAEAAFLRGEKGEARYHAGRAEKALPRGSPGWLQADDILRATEKKED